MQQSGRPRLTRDREHRMLAGVCAGIARTYNLDLTIVRVATVLLAFVSGIGLVGYIALWVLMPAAEVTRIPRPVEPVEDGTDTPRTEEFAARAREAADDLATAARNAAEAARLAADQISEVARAAATAGREAWERTREAQRAASTRPPDAPTSTPPSEPQTSSEEPLRTGDDLPPVTRA